MTRAAVKQFWQVIDRITDAGQCDYYEVVIKVIKQELSIIVWNRCATDIEKLIGYCIHHRTTDFRIRLIRDERENIYNCTHLRFEQHKHGEKNNKFTDLHFFIRSQKRLRELLKKKRYSGKPYTVTSDWQKFQMKLHYKPCDEVYHRSRWINTNKSLSASILNMLNTGSHENG